MKTVLVLIFMFTQSAFAQEDPCERDDQQSLNQCAENIFDTSDRVLNLVWHNLRSCMSGDKVSWNELVKAQRIWVNLKENQCEYEANRDWGRGAFRGTGWPLGYYGCLNQMTKIRTEYLENNIYGCDVQAL